MEAIAGAASEVANPVAARVLMIGGPHRATAARIFRSVDFLACMNATMETRYHAATKIKMPPAASTSRSSTSPVGDEVGRRFAPGMKASSPIMSFDAV